jgi:cold shock CspA family protein
VADPVPSHRPHLGRVTSFDSRRGLGRVADVDRAEYGFHATAIADGTRSIQPGAAVTFVVAPGQRGLYEARALVRVG